jgi:transcriptional regulator with PAS, ATPase and Fis domain
LAKYYVEEFNKKFSKKVKGFSPEAEQLLRGYSWPGNVRELRNIIERIMILQQDTVIITEHLPAEIKNTDKQILFDTQIDVWVPHLTSGGMDYAKMTEKMFNEIKGKIITNAIEISGGNKSKAAKLLHISRYQLMREQKKIINSIS